MAPPLSISLSGAEPFGFFLENFGSKNQSIPFSAFFFSTHSLTSARNSARLAAVARIWASLRLPR